MQLYRYASNTSNTFIASSATKFPKKCVVLCLLGKCFSSMWIKQQAFELGFVCLRLSVIVSILIWHVLFLDGLVDYSLFFHAKT